jgi:tRNA A-37 threonylcarbamoyl transferase component Bud32
MTFVSVNPRYRDCLESAGVRTAEQFLAQPGVVVSGHPDRHVARVQVGGVLAYLKREHRVRLRDRIANFISGFGFITRSQREALLLQELAQAGIGSPEWIAYGEDDAGRAFLLVRALPGAVELRSLLKEHRASAELRRKVARSVGTALARLHAAGFHHPDLYSKHVYVSNDGSQVYFLDWQRSRRKRIGEQERVRTLAALHATLADELISRPDRWRCLRAYQAALHSKADGHFLVSLKKRARQVELAARELIGRRRIRELREASATEIAQELLWLDGEALCVTPTFFEQLGGQIPDWLRLDSREAHREETTLALLALPDGSQGLLVRRQSNQPLRWLWARFRQQSLRTPEVQQAGRLFRRQRQGLPAPRLLAFGQRCRSPWRTESFLLTEVPTLADGGQR